MTRKKWNRLRRQRPELFKMYRQKGCWESMKPEQRNRIVKYGKAEVVERLCAYALAMALVGDGEF